tara:strand:- start:168 stop:518 length:351 start_codon:yes stop_codon:yes gene_type:complete
MATFPSTPEASFPIKKIKENKTNTVQFGDGFEQRLTEGLNQNKLKYSLSWQNITLSEADTFISFLDARVNDQESFDYTPPGETSSFKFVAESGYSKDIVNADRATVRAVFKQVFES